LTISSTAIEEALAAIGGADGGGVVPIGGVVLSPSPP